MPFDKRRTLLAVVLGFLIGALIGYETATTTVEHRATAAALAIQQAHAKAVEKQHKKMFGNVQKGVDNIGKIP